MNKMNRNDWVVGFIAVFLSTILAFPTYYLIEVKIPNDRARKIELQEARQEYTYYVDGIETDVTKINIDDYAVTYNDNKNEAYLTTKTIFGIIPKTLK